VLVDSVSVGPAGSWLVLNVTDPLSSWVAFPDLNLGLYLSVHLPNKPGEWKQPTLPNRTVPKAMHSLSKSKQLRHKDNCHVTRTNSRKRPQATHFPALYECGWPRHTLRKTITLVLLATMRAPNTLSAPLRFFFLF